MLKIGGKTMQEMFKDKLDEDLVVVSEFQTWYVKMMDKMETIRSKIESIYDWVSSIKPTSYVGRVVISTKDDTELKVIGNYGGRKWRRVLNFLRGVSDHDPTLGKKLGEEFVCLRESNIPIHTHAYLAKKGDKISFDRPVDVGVGGESTKVVQTPSDDDDKNKNTLKSATVDCQMSPLECDQKKLFLPHDNMPPYKEVYIWECIESDETQSIDPPAQQCTVTFDANGGNPANPLQKSVSWNSPIGKLPLSDRTGYDFNGWFTRKRGGRPVTENAHVFGDAMLYAHWNPT